MSIVKFTWFNICNRLLYILGEEGILVDHISGCGTLIFETLSMPLVTGCNVVSIRSPIIMVFSECTFKIIQCCSHHQRMGSHEKWRNTRCFSMSAAIALQAGTIPELGPEGSMFVAIKRAPSSWINRIAFLIISKL